MKGFIKICGVTSLEDAEAVIELGADAIGLNLWPRSPRYLEAAAARRIAGAVRGRVAVFAVVVDLEEPALRHLLAELRPDRLQLHGTEPEALVRALQPHAFKAIGLATAADVALAQALPGELVLVDAKDPSRRGGTGKSAPLELARRVSAARRVLLAGGLTSESVGAAIAEVRPWGVDVASGIESSPGKKDRGRLRAFIDAARAAFTALAGESARV